jgi:WhiB family transcriptional regulator, redox-sensing transcriptional regulator
VASPADQPTLANRWKLSAACRPEVYRGDPEIFYPPRLRETTTEMSAARAELIRRAKRVCAVCPVTRECEAYAMDNRETEGIWGGKAPEERGMKQLR